ncbi:MAG: glycine-rich protein [Bacteroidota bacterium]
MISYNTFLCASIRVPVVVTVIPAAPPTQVTATPSSVSCGNDVQLNAIANGNAIFWYTSPTGDTAIGSTVSGANLLVTPLQTTTYYAESAEGFQTFSQTFTNTSTGNTGLLQSWTVPAQVTKITIEAFGAQGGSGSGGSLTGGKGARMKGDFNVTPGDVIKILVGQAGGSSGGPHGNENGGGGGSFVVKQSGNVPLLIAGGGGGGPSTSYGTACSRTASDADGTTSTSGVTVGCSSTGTGGTGGNGGSSNGSYQGGAGGGFYTDGGNGGNHCGVAPGGKSYLNGGEGGFAGSCYGGNYWGGYGGGGCGQLGGPGAGGGYSGGGSAGSWSSYSTYGGGGGSYNAGTNQIAVSGNNTGHGRVIISYTLNPCRSSRVPVIVSVTPLSSASNVTATPDTIWCAGVSALKATSAGNAIHWYDSITGGTLLGSSMSDSTFNVSPLVTTTYYAETFNGNCTTPARVAVVVNVKALTIPTSVTANPDTVWCSGTAGLKATSAGNTIQWFDSVSGGTLLGSSLSDSSFIVAPTVTTTYYAQTFNGNCVMPVRVPVVIHVKTLLIPTSVAASPATIACSGSSDLSATGFGYGIAWYDNSIGGNLLGTSGNGANYNVSPAATTTYYAESASFTIGSQTLNFTDSIVNWTVPYGVTKLDIDAYGAQGGGSTGGLGAKMKGTFAVTPGQVLKILVGETGQYSSSRSGGGGGTFVTDINNNPLVIAGGGGGGGYCDGTNGMPGVITTSGTTFGTGHGSGGSGGFGINGGGGGGGDGGSGGGGGGLLGKGGAGKTFAGDGNGGAGGDGTDGSDGSGSGSPTAPGGESFINGGAGGVSHANGGFGGGGSAYAWNCGGGGGGGYSGGGGGGYNGTQQPGGGGGSINNGTDQINIDGVNPGNGKVIISWDNVLCSSPSRVPITVTVIPLAPATNVAATPDTIWCGGLSNLKAHSTSDTIRWYDSISGGTFLGTSLSDSNFSVNPLVTKTYYAESYDIHCSSPVRVAVTVVVKTLIAPAPLTIAPDTVNCGTGINLTGFTVGSTINWYDLPVGGISIGTSLSGDSIIFYPSSTKTYYAESSLGQCISPSRTSIVAHVISPASPTLVSANPDTVTCGSTVSLSAMGTSDLIYWYDAPSGGNLLGSSSNGGDFIYTPTSTMTYYADAVSTVSGSMTFNNTSTGNTGTLQYFTVPANVVSLNIEAYGASGGNSNSGIGGRGAKMSGTFNVTPGQILTILVGQEGPSQSNDGGGGGGTFVVTNTNTPLIVAGGGGGASYSSPWNGVDGNTSTSGTAGTNGGTGGINGNGGTSEGCAGAGGGFYADGGNGPSCGSTCNGGKSFLNGGEGGCTSWVITGGYGGGGGTHGGGWGGGGGGGYSGGGASTSSQFGGGGGGSYNAGSNQINIAGNNVGHGKVIISWNTVVCSSVARVPVPVTVIAPGNPTSATATPDTITCGGTSNLNSVSAGNEIYWYTSGTGGSPIGHSASGANFIVSPDSTTTFYAESGFGGPVTTVFNYTGNYQTWVVPAGVNSISVKAAGAEGSTYEPYYGLPGKGGIVNTNLAVTPGDTIFIKVGGKPVDYQSSGWNGGAFGSGHTGYYGGGGGGATDLRASDTNYSSLLLVAGGGGGAGYGTPGCHGGDGGGSNIAGDGSFSYGFDGSYCGSGGSQVGGGTGAGGGGTAGTSGYGGDGYCCGYGDGGGGGGYYGGGGGYYYGGGGGGSSWVNPNFSYNSSYYQGGHQGDGQVTITYGMPVCPSSVRIPVTVIVKKIPGVTMITALPDTLCLGGQTTLVATSANGSINWYTTPTGGVSIGNTQSGAGLTQSLSATTTYYAEVVSGGAGSLIFDYTGGLQSWVVPSGITSVTVDVYGAQGGRGNNGYSSGGLGGRIKSTLSVTPGQSLHFMVGGAGGSGGLQGWNGGGKGSLSNPENSGAGGGASDIRIGGYTLNDRVIVAGGGGGASYACGSGSENGGAGGDTVGGNGNDCNHYIYSTCGGGATKYSGGTGGSNGGIAGGFGYGGAGYVNYAGGGGGGYYGGGGGYASGAGGGGSSWVNPALSNNTSYSKGIKTGNGQVRISWSGASCISNTRVPVVVIVRPNPTLTVTPISDSMCFGGNDTIHAMATGGVGNFTYYWTKSSLNCNSGDSIIAGADSSILAINALTHTTYYKCIITQSGVGCNTVVSSCATITVLPDPIAPIITAVPSDTNICDNQTLSIIPVSGSGGFGICTDEYRYSKDSGATWTAWSSTIPVFSAVVGTNIIEGRRNCGETGCNSNISRVHWNIVAQPIAPIFTKIPATDSVCSGTAVSATLLTPGSGGVGSCTDYYQYRLDGGGWQTYTLGANLNTANHSVAQIRAVKGNCLPGSGCQSENIYTWILINTPMAPPQVLKTPNLSSVCEGTDVSAIMGSNGTGGIGCSDFMEYNFDGGTWQLYSPGMLLATASHTQVNIRAFHGNCDSLSGCSASTPELVSWTITSQPASPILTRFPDVDSVCDGMLVSATIQLGSGGSGCTDSVQYRTLDNFGWSAWISYNPGSLLNSSGKDSVEVRAFRGNCNPGAGCQAGTINMIAWVIASQVSSPVLAAIPNSSTVCLGTTLSGIASGGSGGIAPLTYEYQYMEPGTTTWVNGQTWTPAASGIAYMRARTVSAGAGCGVSSWEVTAWTVVADPIISGITADTVCTGGSSIVSISVSGGVGTTTYQWENSPFGCNGPWTQVGTNSPSLNTGSLTATQYYRCLVNQSGSDCNATSSCITVVVIPDPVLSSLTDDTICSGQSTTLSVTSTGGYGSPQYQWQQSTVGCNGPWLNIGGNASSLITGSLTNTTYYHCIVTQPGIGGCQSTTGCATITVPGTPTQPMLTGTPNNAVVCLGTTLSGIASGGSGGIAPLTYEYQYMEPGTTTWVNGQTWTPAASGIAYMRARTVSAGAGCGVSSWEVTAWTVVADPIISGITADTVCTGGSSIVSISVSGGVGTTTYQWENSPFGCNGPWTQVGTNSPSLNTGSLTATQYYRCLVNQSGSDCNATSSCITVVVIPDPVLSSLTDDTICSGQSTTLSVTSTGGYGSPQYQWQQSTVGCNGPWLNIGGNASSLITGSLNTTTYYHCIVTQPGIGGCQSTTGCATIIVPGAPTQPVLTGTPNNAVVCLGTTLSGIASGGSGGIAPLTYEYQYMEPGTSVWVSGQTWTPSASGIAYMRARTVSAGAGCGVSAWEVIAWTVIPALTTTGPVDDSVCYNTSANVSVSVNGGLGTAAYQWQYSANGCNGPWTNVGTSNAVYNTGALIADAWFRCIVNLSGSVCTDTSGCAKVSVIAIPNVIAPVDAHICIGDTANLSVTVNGGTGSISYQWQYSSSGCGGPWTNTGMNSPTYSEAATTSATYQCVITQSVGSCSVTSGCAAITVNPVYSFSESQNTCAGVAYNWHGTDYLSSGTYFANYTTSLGCDSTYTLHLTVDTVETGVSISGVTITSLATNATYQWLNCDSSYAPISGQTMADYTPATDGNYAVLVTQGACSDTSACIAIMTTGISAADNMGISLYPNPSNGNFTITLDENAEVEVFNAIGSLVYTNRFAKGTHQLSLDLADGVYLLKAYDNKVSHYFKMVIQK